jgi:hypothetical protein
MRRRTKIIGLSILILLVVVLVCLLTPGKVKVDSLTFIISTNAPHGYNSFFSAVLTNKTVLPFELEMLGVQLETEDDKVILHLAEPWTAKDGKQTSSLPPKGFLSVSPQADSKYKRIRLVAQHSSDAGRLARALNPVMRTIDRKLPLSNGVKQWIGRHGLIDAGFAPGW